MAARLLSPVPQFQGSELVTATTHDLQVGQDDGFGAGHLQVTFFSSFQTSTGNLQSSCSEHQQAHKGVTQQLLC